MSMLCTGQVRASGAILVTDDDEDLRDIVRISLESSGFEVLTAGNGREALERVASRMPSVILLDMRMPIMNGWQFASEFRSRFDRCARVVVMTAAEHASNRAREIDADGWLAKPFGREELIAMVRGHAERRP
jgi:DNA-binding response OmpR family regulator